MGTGEQTVALFFEKKNKTDKIWYYQLNPGRNLGKTNPLNNQDLKDSWIKLQRADLKPDGYVYNVIFSALHFIKANKTLEDAVKFSGKANYCAIIVSVIMKCLNKIY